MIVIMLPTPRSVTSSWLANVASGDVETFFSNNIGFCSFGQDPQVHQPLQFISNCYITILVSEKKNKQKIVSNKIKKTKQTLNMKKKKYYHFMSTMMHINVLFIRCCCRHRLLRHIQFNKCVILLNRQNSRRIL